MFEFPNQETRGRYWEKGEGKKLLHALEKSGDYVFHGSPTPDIEELEVRQPQDSTRGMKENHGEPCVAASPYVDIAIFRSLVRSDTTRFGEDGGRLHFGATQKALDAAKNRVGYVYVLSRTDFAPFDEGSETSMDWRSRIAQKPVQIVPVVYDDLPKGVCLIETKKSV